MSGILQSVKEAFDGTTSYVLTEGLGHNTLRRDGNEYRFLTLREASLAKRGAAIQTGIPENKIHIIRETREVMNA